MTAIAAFLTDLPQTWKAVTALVGAASFGAVVALTTVGFVGLPSDVEANAGAIAENTQFRVDHTREFEALVCLITLPDSVASDSRARTRECGL